MVGSSPAKLPEPLSGFYDAFPRQAEMHATSMHHKHHSGGCQRPAERSRQHSWAPAVQGNLCRQCAPHLPLCIHASSSVPVLASKEAEIGQARWAYNVEKELACECRLDRNI